MHSEMLKRVNVYTQQNALAGHTHRKYAICYYMYRHYTAMYAHCMCGATKGYSKWSAETTNENSVSHAGSVRRVSYLQFAGRETSRAVARLQISEYRCQRTWLSLSKKSSLRGT